MYLELSDMKDMASPELQKKFYQVYDVFTNSGWALSQDDDDSGSPTRFDIQDLLQTSDATRFIPKVVQYIVREAIEPNLVVIPNLFQQIRMEAGRMIEVGAIGALYAAEIPEGAPYPERSLDVEGGDMIAVAVSKHGLKISVTDELISDSQWDVLNMWLRAAGRALARHKEKRAMQLLDAMGITIFNNDQSGVGALPRIPSWFTLWGGSSSW
jgi:hypothetical protein